MTVRKCALCFGVIFLLFGASASFGAAPAYLQLQGQNQGLIGGDANESGHGGWIEVTSFEHGVSQPGSRNTGDPNSNGKPTGKKDHQDLKITKPIDSSTPKLMRAWDDAEPFTNFRLEFMRMEGGVPVHYYTIELVNAQIMAIRQVKLNTDDPANDWSRDMESLYFTYDRVIRTFEAASLTEGADWACEDAQVLRISDLNFDGAVNLLDLAKLASEWLEE